MTDSNKIPVDLIIEAQWIVPVVPRNHVLTRSAVVIQHEKIVEIASIESVKAKYTSTKTIVLNEHVLIPGLINLHAHVGMTLMRGLLMIYL